MSTAMSPILVVGASLAGLTATETLRNGGYDGELDRRRPVTAAAAGPPAAVQAGPGRRLGAGAAAHRSRRPGCPELDVDLRLGVAATALDAASRVRVTLSDGSTVDAVRHRAGHGRIAPAPARRARHGVHVLRTMEDCLALRAELDAGPARVVVIGAGFIGAEVAATCRGRGLEVTMIEAAPGAAGAGAARRRSAAFIADLHREHGVDVRLGVGVDGLEADGSTVGSARCAWPTARSSRPTWSSSASAWRRRSDWLAGSAG